MVHFNTVNWLWLSTNLTSGGGMDEEMDIPEKGLY